VFWVNSLDEARLVCTQAPEATAFTLMGLGGDHIHDFVDAGAIPALASLAEVEHCARYALQTQRRIAVAIQVDTGLGRLGLSREELDFIASRPEILDRLDIRLWVSHLAAYNLPD